MMFVVNVSQQPCNATIWTRSARNLPRTPSRYFENHMGLCPEWNPPHAAFRLPRVLPVPRPGILLLPGALTLV